MSSTAQISALLGEPPSPPNMNEAIALMSLKKGLYSLMPEGPPAPRPGHKASQKQNEDKKEQKSLIELLLEFAQLYSGQENVNNISEEDLEQIETAADQFLQDMGMTQEQSQELIQGFKEPIGMSKQLESEEGAGLKKGAELENAEELAQGAKKGLEDDDQLETGQKAGNRQERTEEAGNTQENIDTPAVDAPSLGGSMKP